MQKNQKKQPLNAYKAVNSLDFLLPVLHKYPSGWLVEYWVQNPFSKKLERFRNKVNSIRRKATSTKQGEKLVLEYMSELSSKLKSGWTPYTGDPAPTCVNLYNALDLFLENKERRFKINDLRLDSIRYYRTHISAFQAYLLKKKIDLMPVDMFSKKHAKDYVSYIIDNRNLRAVSLNNNIVCLRTMFNWFIEEDYITVNPFNTIKKLRVEEKIRKPIPAQVDSVAIEWFRSNNPVMVLVCSLIYSSGMRVAEICRTEIQHIHFDKSAILLPGTKSKNHTSRWCVLAPYQMDMIKVLLRGIQVPEHHYLIGSSLLSGPTPMKRRQLDKYWHEMRKATGIPMCYQLYSYRDTLIMDMKMQGHGNLFISRITGHLSEEMLNKYTHEPPLEALEYVVNQGRAVGNRVSYYSNTLKNSPSTNSDISPSLME